MDDYSFDLHRIIIGDYPLLIFVEIALRTAVMLFYLLLLLRLIGKRSLTQFSPFELILIIALGSAVGDPMFYPEIPLLHGMVVITVVALIERFLAIITNEDEEIEGLLEGTPLCLLIEGRFLLDNLKKSTLSRNEIYMELRVKQIEQLGQVRRAYIELDGEMSVFVYEKEQARIGLPILPEWDAPEMRLSNVPAPKTADYACFHCGQVIHVEAGEPLAECPHCQEKEWLEALRTVIP